MAKSKNSETFIKILPNGFTILPLEIPCKSVPSKSVTHQIFLKQHESTSESPLLPPSRTLFIMNIPVDTTVSHIRHLFRHCGKIERIQFKCTRTNIGLTQELTFDEEIDESQFGSERSLLELGTVTYVVFKTEAGLERALTLKQKKRIWSDEMVNNPKEKQNKVTGDLQKMGISRYLSLIRKRQPDHQNHQMAVDKFMAEYEAAEKASSLEQASKHNQMDEDGFILVTRKGRRNTNTDGDITVTAIKSGEAKKLKPKKKELSDFYRFQMREAKRNKFVELRRKFEEDKKKIEELRAARRFKPY